MSFLVLKALLETDSFRSVLGGGGNFAALYNKVRKYPVGEPGAIGRRGGTDLLGRRHGLHLVLEGSAVPTALRGLQHVS